jgi:hypothetical protein
LDRLRQAPEDSKKDARPRLVTIALCLFVSTHNFQFPMLTAS